jgi:hypothetical protein
MSEQALPRHWLSRSVPGILTFFVVAGAMIFAFS